MIRRVSVPVLSVGNLTTGGTGKTPMVEWLCQFLRKKGGVRVALLSRGYGSHGAGMNDEALELQLSLPDVPHLQDPDRVKIAEIAVEELASQALVMDDGFQHRRLHRDLDLVLIDATCPFGYGHCLPRGLLREPLSGLSRADAVILTRCDQVGGEVVEQIKLRLTRVTRGQAIPIATCVHQPQRLIDCNGGQVQLSELSGRKVLAIAGIGNPQSFFRSIEGLGAEIVSRKVFEDHFDYQRADLEELKRWVSAESLEASKVGETNLIVVTTRKDLVKLGVHKLAGRSLLALEVQLQFLTGQDEIEALVKSKILNQVQEDPW